MAESTFRTPSTVQVDSIEVDIASPVDGQVILYNGTKYVAGYHVPVGTMEMWGGSSTSVPHGWLLCDGQQVLSSSTLGQVLSTRYNTGGETAGHVRVPNMSAVIPIGIASGANAGTTTFSYAAQTSVHTHSAFTATNAIGTNVDGGNHDHTYQAGGDHQHSLNASDYTHHHSTNAVSNVHRHEVLSATGANANTGFTAHAFNDHGATSADNASHEHSSGVQNHGHAHTVTGNATQNTHSHLWSNSANTPTTSNAGQHTHSVSVVSICFIIKS